MFFCASPNLHLCTVKDIPSLWFPHTFLKAVEKHLVERHNWWLDIIWLKCYKLLTNGNKHHHLTSSSLNTYYFHYYRFFINAFVLTGMVAPWGYRGYSYNYGNQNYVYFLIVSDLFFFLHAFYLLQANKKGKTYKLPLSTFHVEEITTHVNAEQDLLHWEILSQTEVCALFEMVLISHHIWLTSDENIF